jgi:quercetin dioxygenase-like cupin family protein
LLPVQTYTDRTFVTCDATARWFFCDAGTYKSKEQPTMKQSAVNPGNESGRAPSIKHQPRSNRYYFDVGIGGVCLSGNDTGGAYCLLDVGLAPGMMVPRHTHTREDEVYYVLRGELEVIVADEVFILKAGDTLMAPRDIPHQLRNSGNVENHYLLMFSPSGFEEFLMATAVPAPDNAAAPTEPPAVTVRNVHELAASYGIQFG